MLLTDIVQLIPEIYPFYRKLMILIDKNRCQYITVISELKAFEAS